MSDQSALVWTLLHPGVTETLSELRAAHLRQDRAALAALEQVLSFSPADDSLPIALKSFAQRLEDLPACGGLHAATPEMDVVAAAVGCLCESALYEEYDDMVSVSASGLSELALPRTGLTVVLPEPADVQCHAAPDGVIISAHGGELARIGRADSGGCELLAAAPGVRAMRRSVMSGVAVEGGYLKYASQLPDSADVLDRALDAQERDRLEVAFGLLDAVAPGLSEELHEEKVRLIALQPRPGVLRQSCSFRSAPGVVFLNLSDPLEILDLLCHEYHHLKLFRLQETVLLLNRPTAPVRAPWRADRRMAEGLLHGTYVFYMCAWLLDRVFCEYPPSQRGQTRRVVFRACIEAGLDELERAPAEPSPLGRCLMSAIREGNDGAMADLQAASPNAVAWARGAVGDHMARVGASRGREPWFLGL